MLLLATSALGMATALPAVAQEADEEIVVTARRTEERLQDVPISITVFNQEQLSDRNVISSTDLATFTPSLAIESRYGTDKATFGIRGFMQDQATSATVGVYFADVVSVRGGGPTSAGDGVGPGNFFDLQNVQVLKGPQGTLFGRNTTGGAILLVPQRPESELGGYYEMSLGNYDMHREQGVLNLPVTDTFAVRLGVDHQQRDGYLENHSGIGPSDFADVNYTALRGSALWDITPNLENYTVISYSESNTNGTIPRLFACNTTPPALPGGVVQQIYAPAACAQLARMDARGDGWWDVENSNPDAHSDLESWQFTNHLTWSVSDALSVKWISGYGEFRENTSININGDNPITTTAAQFVQFASPAGFDTTSQATLVQELQLQGSAFADRLSWQAGVYYEHSYALDPNQTLAETMLRCTDRDALLCVPETAFGGFVTLGSMSRSISENEYTTEAVYAQGSYDITDQLTVTAGLRYTSDRITGYNENLRYIFPAAGNPPGPVDISCNNTAVFGTAAAQPQVLDSRVCHLNFVEESDATTGVLDLEYSVTEDLMVYAKYSRGYRQGGINAANPTFETWGPESVDTYEIGAKTSFDTDAVSGFFNVAVFTNDFTDMQIQTSALGIPGSGFSGGTVILNAGAATISGVEIDASLNFFDSLRLDLGYAYLDTELEELTLPPAPLPFPYASITPTAVVGGPLAFSPENRITAGLIYTLPLDQSIGDVSVGVSYVWTDEQQTNAASPFGFIDSTQLVNANLNWDSIGGGPLDFSVFVTNLTEEEFPTHVTATWNSAGFEGTFVNEPRMIGARLRARFGAEAN
jgi:iron complex outermembrane receptor protein